MIKVADRGGDSGHLANADNFLSQNWRKIKLLCMESEIGENTQVALVVGTVTTFDEPLNFFIARPTSLEL